MSIAQIYKNRIQHARAVTQTVTMKVFHSSPDVKAAVHNFIVICFVCIQTHPSIGRGSESKSSSVRERVTAP